MNKRNLLRIVIVVGAAAYLGYTHFHNRASEPTAKLAAPIAADAKQFTLGTLDFKSCEIKQKHSGATTMAFCAPFSVLENRDAPDGRKIDLRLALIKSRASAANSDIVVFLAGGPGQAAVDTWPQIASSFEPLLKHHHVLLLDQRGTGESNRAELQAFGRHSRQRAKISIRKKRGNATRECLADRREKSRSALLHDDGLPPKISKRSAARWAARSSTSSAFLTERAWRSNI